MPYLSATLMKCRAVRSAIANSASIHARKLPCPSSGKVWPLRFQRPEKDAASVLDSVAAYSKLVTKQVLLGEGAAAKILAAAGKDRLSTAQTTIAQDGPGKDLLYRAPASTESARGLEWSRTARAWEILSAKL